MQVILEDDSTSVLGIPYGHDSTRQFWNLKRFPDLIESVPELADCSDLKAFVRAVNGPASRFGTLGCEKWMKDVDYPNGATKEAGLYVDIIFDMVELAWDHDNYARFAAVLKEHGDALRAKDDTSDWTLIRVHPQKVGFFDIDQAGWFMSVRVYGVGNSEEMAVDWRTRGLRELLDVLLRVSKEIDAGHGASGTRLFELLKASDLHPKEGTKGARANGA